jgi:hypothetical protein
MLSIQKQLKIKRNIFVNMEQAIQDYCSLTGAKPLISSARPRFNQGTWSIVGLFNKRRKILF